MPHLRQHSRFSPLRYTRSFQPLISRRRATLTTVPLIQPLAFNPDTVPARQTIPREGIPDEGIARAELSPVMSLEIHSPELNPLNHDVLPFTEPFTEPSPLAESAAPIVSPSNVAQSFTNLSSNRTVRLNKTTVSDDNSVLQKGEESVEGDRPAPFASPSAKSSLKSSGAPAQNASPENSSAKKPVQESPTGTAKRQQKSTQKGVKRSKQAGNFSPVKATAEAIETEAIALPLNLLQNRSFIESPPPIIEAVDTVSDDLEQIQPQQTQTVQFAATPDLKLIEPVSFIQQPENIETIVTARLLETPEKAIAPSSIDAPSEAKNTGVQNTKAKNTKAKNTEVQNTATQSAEPEVLEVPPLQTIRPAPASKTAQRDAASRRQRSSKSSKKSLKSAPDQSSALSPKSSEIPSLIPSFEIPPHLIIEQLPDQAIQRSPKLFFQISQTASQLNHQTAVEIDEAAAARPFQKPDCLTDLTEPKVHHTVRRINQAEINRTEINQAAPVQTVQEFDALQESLRRSPLEQSDTASLEFEIAQQQNVEQQQNLDLQRNTAEPLASLQALEAASPVSEVYEPSNLQVGQLPTIDRLAERVPAEPVPAKLDLVDLIKADLPRTEVAKPFNQESVADLEGRAQPEQVSGGQNAIGSPEQSPVSPIESSDLAFPLMPEGNGTSPFQGFSVGGQVIQRQTPTGKPIAPSDTVPAMLTPGEFVVNAQDTQKHLPLLRHLNQGGGLDNAPMLPVAEPSIETGERSVIASQLGEGVIVPSTTPLISRKSKSIQRQRKGQLIQPQILQTTNGTFNEPSPSAAGFLPLQQSATQETESEDAIAYSLPSIIHRSPDTAVPPQLAPRSSSLPLPEQWDSVEDLLGVQTTYGTAGTERMPPANAAIEMPAIVHRQVAVQGFEEGGEVSSSPVMAAETETPPAKTTTISAEKEDGKDKEQKKEAEMENLAQEIYTRLRLRLEIERERQGVYRGRLPW